MNETALKLVDSWYTEFCRLREEDDGYTNNNLREPFERYQKDVLDGSIEVGSVVDDLVFNALLQGVLLGLAARETQ